MTDSENSTEYPNEIGESLRPKTAAERMREYRARKKNKTTIETKVLPKKVNRKPPKSVAERSREYRARKKNQTQSRNDSTTVNYDDDNIRINANDENMPEFIECGTLIDLEEEFDLENDSQIVVSKDPSSLPQKTPAQRSRLSRGQKRNRSPVSSDVSPIEKRSPITVAARPRQYKIQKKNKNVSASDNFSSIYLENDKVVDKNDSNTKNATKLGIKQEEEVDSETEDFPGFLKSDIQIKDETEIDLGVDEIGNVPDLSATEVPIKTEKETDSAVNQAETEIQIKQEKETDFEVHEAENVPDPEIQIKQEKEIPELNESENLFKYEVDLGVDEINNVSGPDAPEIPIKQEKEIDLGVNEVENVPEFTETEDLLKYETEIDLGIDEIRDVSELAENAIESRKKSAEKSVPQANTNSKKLENENLPSPSRAQEDNLTINKNLVNFINSRKVLTIFTFNCQSLRAQSNDQNFLIVKNPNILILSDIRLGDEDEKSIPNFNCIVKFKEPNSAEGVKVSRGSDEQVLTILTPSIDFSVTDSNLHNSIASKVGEFCMAKCLTKNGQYIIIAAIYISLNQNLDDIIYFVHRSLLAYTIGGATLLRSDNHKIPMILGGDFKVDFTSEKSAKLLEFLKQKLQLSLELKPQASTIKSNTRVGAVFTRFLNEFDCRTYTAYFSYPNLLVRTI